MTLPEALEKVLRSYKTYYNINLDDPAPPFAAEAVFLQHDKQYLLVKAARIAESDSSEHVFFALEDALDRETFEKLDLTAWQTGISRADPVPGHKSTDVTLVILTNRLDDDAAALIRKRKHYQSYLFGLRGWSSYRLAVIEVPTGKCVHNPRGSELKALARIFR